MSLLLSASPAPVKAIGDWNVRVACFTNTACPPVILMPGYCARVAIEIDSTVYGSYSATASIMGGHASTLTTTLTTPNTALSSCGFGSNSLFVDLTCWSPVGCPGWPWPTWFDLDVTASKYYASPGSYTVTVLAVSSDGLKTRSVTVSFVVQAFTVSVNPTDLTVNQNQAGQTTVSVTSAGGFSGQVSFAVYGNGSPLGCPPNALCARNQIIDYNLAAVQVPAGGTVRSVLTLSVGTSVPPGIYQLTIYGITYTCGAGVLCSSVYGDHLRVNGWVTSTTLRLTVSSSYLTAFCCANTFAAGKIGQSSPSYSTLYTIAAGAAVLAAILVTVRRRRVKKSRQRRPEGGLE